MCDYIIDAVIVIMNNNYKYSSRTIMNNNYKYSSRTLMNNNYKYSSRTLMNNNEQLMVIFTIIVVII